MCQWTAEEEEETPGFGPWKEDCTRNYHERKNNFSNQTKPFVTRWATQREIYDNWNSSQQITNAEASLHTAETITGKQTNKEILLSGNEIVEENICRQVKRDQKTGCRSILIQIKIFIRKNMLNTTTRSWNWSNRKEIEENRNRNGGNKGK